NTVPGPQALLEEGAVTFSVAAGNALRVSDVDVSAGLMQVTLNASGGTLTLGTPGVVTFSAGDGTADPTMTFTATLASINTALNGLSFTPTANFGGAGQLAIFVSDLGAAGTGGTLTAQGTVNITINPTNDPPDAVNDTFSIAEDALSTAVP